LRKHYYLSLQKVLKQFRRECSSKGALIWIGPFFCNRNIYRFLTDFRSFSSETSANKFALYKEWFSKTLTNGLAITIINLALRTICWKLRSTESGCKSFRISRIIIQQSRSWSTN
jgi:hypothetical protein